MSDVDTAERDRTLFMRHRLAMSVAIAFFALAVVSFVLMADDGSRAWIQTIDDTVRDGAQSSQWGPFTVLAMTLNVIGSWYVTWPLRAAVAWLLWSKRRWEAFGAWVGALVVYEPLISIVKALYGRPRPPDPAVHITGFSFPSGHASVGAAVAIGLVIVLLPAGRRRRYYEVVAGAFAFAMAASRIYLDAHWMSDVIAGTALGAAVMIGAAAVAHEVSGALHARKARVSAAPP